MDLKALKLELLERIAQLDDEARLLALKRLLDSHRAYGMPNEHLSVVREGLPAYLKIEDRSYTADEVRGLVEEMLRQVVETDPAGDFSPEEWAAMERDHVLAQKGESRFFTVEEVMAQLRKDRGA